MKIIVCSDNHGHHEQLDYILKNHKDSNYLIHCGDSLMPKQLMSNFYSVKGNGDSYDYPDEIILELNDYYKVMIIHGNKHIIFKDRTVIANYAKSKGCNLLFFGHTHVFEDVIVDGIRCINPGCVVFNRDQTPGSYACITLNDMDINVIRCEFE